MTGSIIGKVSPASFGVAVAEARRREAKAKERGERYKVDPEVRAARAAMLEARQAAFDQAEAEAKAKQEASPSALQAILSRASIDELAEVSRSIGRMDPRRIEELVNETFRAKSRSQAYRPDDEAPAPVAPSATALAEIAMGAGGSAKASSASRTR